MKKRPNLVKQNNISIQHDKALAEALLNDSIKKASLLYKFSNVNLCQIDAEIGLIKSSQK
jgi:hypothetical protein